MYILVKEDFYMEGNSCTYIKGAIVIASHFKNFNSFGHYYIDDEGLEHFNWIPEKYCEILRE